MNKFIFLKLTLIISTICFGQKIIVNNQEHTGRLTWADFTGKIDNNSSFTAYTSYKFGTKIESVKTEGDSITINGFEIILELDQTKSTELPRPPPPKEPPPRRSPPLSPPPESVHFSKLLK